MIRYVLNSAVLAAGEYGIYDFTRGSWPEAREWLARGPVESRVGYQETADLIHRETGVRLPLSRETSAMADGDEALVVRLRYRVAEPGRKGAPTSARPEDWEVAFLRRTPMAIVEAARRGRALYAALEAEDYERASAWLGTVEIAVRLVEDERIRTLLLASVEAIRVAIAAEVTS